MSWSLVTEASACSGTFAPLHSLWRPFRFSWDSSVLDSYSQVPIRDFLRMGLRVRFICFASGVCIIQLEKYTFLQLQKKKKKADVLKAQGTDNKKRTQHQRGRAICDNESISVVSTVVGIVYLQYQSYCHKFWYLNIFFRAYLLQYTIMNMGI